MKFTLIVSTKGRTKEIPRVFESFRNQTLQDFEVIISDQNDDDRIVELLKEIAWPGKLTHVRSFGGASAARNKALEIAQGELIAFPDDDCVFFPTCLADVAEFFSTHPEYGYLCGRSVADDGSDAASVHSKEAGNIQRYAIYQQCIEFAMFVRRSSLGDIRFDEKMGVGCLTPWQADEGPDLMLNLEAKGVRGYYDPKFAVWHPKVELVYNEALNVRTYKYGCGSGYFLRKHNYPFWYFLKLNLRTFCGVLLGLATLHPGKAKCYWARFRGRWRGWTSFSPA